MTGAKEKECGERLDRIFELIRREGFSSPDDIAPAVGVSAITVRRDLKLLEEKGLVRHVRGGAVPLVDNAVDFPVAWRVTRDVETKRKIALYAASLVNERETLMVDAGSTCRFLCEALPENKNLRVVTHSLENVCALRGKKGVEVICPGGALDAALGAFYGPVTENGLALFFADKSFLGSSGINIMMGCVNSFMFETRIKMMMNTQTKESYILADSSKFGVAGFHSNIPLGSIKTIITDSLARPEDTGVFRAKNINVITV